jgi:uncharacterized protein (DUF58 family)
MRTRTAHAPHFTPITAVLAVVWFVLGEAEDVTLQRSLRFTILVLAVANFVLAIQRVRRVSLRVVAQPTRCFVGDSPALQFEVTGARSGVRLRIASSDRSPWVVAVGDGTGTVPGTTDFRGVATHLVVQVRSDGPLNILGYSQTRTVSIRPLYIGPRPEAPDPPIDLASTDAAVRASAIPIDDVPSVIREYQPGDPWRQISWPATARAGRLMTRDHELGTDRDLTLVLDLGPMPGVAGEHAASVAAWVGSQVLARGWRLELVALGPRGDFSGPVDAIGLHHRLALAQYGDVPRPVDHRYLLVSPNGVGWR